MVLASFGALGIYLQTEKLESQPLPGATAAFCYKAGATLELQDAFFMRQIRFQFQWN